MRLVLLFVTLLFLTPGLSLAGINPRLDSMAVTVLGQLNLPAAGTATVTLPRVYTAVNRGISKVCTDFPAIEKLDTLTADSAVDGVALNTDFSRMRTCFWSWSDSLRIPLQTVPPGAFEDTLFAYMGTIAHQLNNKENPRYSWEFSKRLFFHPKFFSSVYGKTFLITYYAQDTVLQTAASTTQINEDYLEMVVLYATFLVARMAGKHADANAYRDDYIALRGDR